MQNYRPKFSSRILSFVLAMLMIVSVMVSCAPADTTPDSTTATNESTTAESTTAATTEQTPPTDDGPINDPDAPIAYFSFDTLNENKQFIEDKSGKACRPTKTPTQVRGKHGKALNLDGESYLTFNMDHPSGNQAHSVAAWIKVDTSRTKTGTQVIVGWGDYNVAYHDMRVQILNNKLCITTRNAHSCTNLPGDISSTWHHVAFSYEKRVYRVYLDGKQIATFSTPRDIQMVETPLYIGSFADEGFYFPGQIDDLYIFDRAITPNEVKGCMENAKNFSEIEKNPDNSIVSTVSFKKYSGTVTGKNYCNNIEFSYEISVPQFSNIKEYALAVTFDRLNNELAQTMANLYEEGIAPPTVTIGIKPGVVRNTQGQSTNLNARQFTFDVFSEEFPNFLVEELLPQVIKNHSLKISDSPDMHMAAGGSSAGMCAWSCAWFRNDYFHRVYMSSPTFSGMTKGFMAPVYMRLYETKAIRGFMDYGENEPNEYFGSSYLAAKNAESALKYAGYQIEFRYNEGEGHCSQLNNIAGLTEAMRYTWANWKSVAVRPPRNTTYIEKFVSINQKWTVTTEAMPTKFRAIAANGEYTFEGGTIYFTPDNGTKREVATGFAEISSIAVSSDMWRLYIASKTDNTVYAMQIEKNGNLKGKMILASLYTSVGSTYPGATQLYVGSQDRIYAVTEMGVQVIRSHGPIEAILTLPDGQIPEEIVFGGANNSYMYARCGDTVYKRLWKIPGRASETTVSVAVTRDYYN